VGLGVVVPACAEGYTAGGDKDKTSLLVTANNQAQSPSFADLFHQLLLSRSPHVAPLL